MKKTTIIAAVMALAVTALSALPAEAHGRRPRSQPVVLLQAAPVVYGAPTAAFVAPAAAFVAPRQQIRFGPLGNVRSVSNF
jgi:hypothetical protein